MLSGSCLCGNIQYELDHEVELLIFCHCSRCRKESGSTFNTATPIDVSAFSLAKGQDTLAHYAESGINRYLCPRCGCHFYTVRDNVLNTYQLRVGTLNSNIYPQKKSISLQGLKQAGILFVMIIRNLRKCTASLLHPVVDSLL